MSLILSIETSGILCSVAIHDSGKLISELEIDIPQAHGSMLARLIEQTIQKPGINKSDLSAIAVSAGPGSYTGLRIGVSTAKGLCYALDIPLVAISTLEIMARQVDAVKEDLLCPMIDARRMEVYCQLFTKTFHALNDVEAKVIESNSFEEYTVNKKVLFFGDGSDKCREVLSHPNSFFTANIKPKASGMGEMAYKKLMENKIEDLTTFEPFYLKTFQLKNSVS